jgi:DNA repair exonuclease SbcCD ATPase subunit
MSTQVSSFVREVVARLKGDQQEVVAAKNERKAMSAFKSNVAALESKIVDAEEQLDQANENLKTAMYPTEYITDNASYLSGISSAAEKVEQAQENLSALKDSLKTWESRKKLMFG